MRWDESRPGWLVVYDRCGTYLAVRPRGLAASAALWAGLVLGVCFYAVALRAAARTLFN